MDEKTKPVNLSKFLSNPALVAGFRGGEIPTQISELSQDDLSAYLNSLNGKILEIDRKILPLEALKEKGMNFLASAPSFIQEIFKWLLSLPIVGDIFAKFLGYSDGDMAIEGVGKELEERKSLNILAQLSKNGMPESSDPESKKLIKIELIK